IMTTHKPIEVQELFGDLEPAEENRKWFVVHTKPRREKKLAQYSLQNKINYYLPLKDSIRVYQYRKVKFTKPLFSGYVFVKCDSEERRILTITGHTAYFLPVPNEEVFTGELKQIHFGRLKGADYRKAEFLEKGMKVIITSGPFEGLTGVVEDGKNVKRVILQVNLLRQAVSISASAKQIKIIKE
ncbi:MAG: hypothetical protein K8R49_05090, partial [Candidatus Cloacimonetes bacterium]|nr:hypothetical protein [Candidatus Cloacimonadota bacterium]